MCTCKMNNRNQFKVTLFRCTFGTCSSTFSTSTNLCRHMKEHAGIKPYKCRTCGKQFGRSFSLRRHMVTHTGEKTYECEFPHCNKRFNTSGNLSRHKRTHLKNKGIPRSPDLISESLCLPTEATLPRDWEDCLELACFPELLKMCDFDKTTTASDSSQPLLNLNWSHLEPIEFNASTLASKSAFELQNAAEEGDIEPLLSTDFPHKSALFESGINKNSPCSLSFISEKDFDELFSTIDADYFQESLSSICDSMLHCIELGLLNHIADFQRLSNDAYKCTVLQDDKDSQRLSHYHNFGSSISNAISASKHLKSALHDRMKSLSRLLQLLNIININAITILKRPPPSVKIVEHLATHLVMAKSEAKNYNYLQQRVDAAYSLQFKDENGVK